MARLRRVLALLLVLAVACSADGGPRPLEVAEAWRDANRRLDVDAMMALYADDEVELIDPHFSQPLLDKADIRQSYEDLFELDDVMINTGIPAVADRRVTIEWLWRGTDQATGDEYSIRGVSVLTVDDGLIVREAAYYDTTHSPFVTMRAGG